MIEHGNIDLEPILADLTGADSSGSKFMLVHLENPPEGISKQEVVRRLHPSLKKAITKARIWCDAEDQHGRRPSNEEIVKRFPIFQDANSREIQYIFDREMTPHQCAIEIISKRTPAVASDTIKRYLRVMKQGKPRKQ